MAIEIITVGGYNEVGKNMTAVKYGKEIVLLDMGLHLDSYIKYTEEEREESGHISGSKLIEVGAAPDISVIQKLDGEVKAIVPTHAHLDHMGAIPYLAGKFKDAEIVGTPYTHAVLDAILKDDKREIKNKRKVMKTNDRYKVSDNIEIEFINVTHSIPHTVIAVVHTPEGSVIYSNDFKFDNTPTLGEKSNYERLKSLKNVRALICNSIYSSNAAKTPSEQVAKDMLRDVMLGVDNKGKALVVTTFSSHLARLKSIIEFGKKLNRKIVFLGRSLSKYVKAGEDVGLVNFSKDVEIVKYRKQVINKLKQIEKQGVDKYILVITGHQGEPKAVLSRMVDRSIPFNFYPGDTVIFSCRTIPTKLNIDNRAYLEKNLSKLGVRIFKDVHVSGHDSKEDIRDLIEMTKPEHLIPSHAPDGLKEGMVKLGVEMGYKKGKTIHVMHNKQRVAI